MNFRRLINSCHCEREQSVAGSNPVKKPFALDCFGFQPRNDGYHLDIIKRPDLTRAIHGVRSSSAPLARQKLLSCSFVRQGNQNMGVLFILLGDYQIQ